MEEKPNTQDRNPERHAGTSPPSGKTHEATTPPGQGVRDEEAIRVAEEKLSQAGGGH
jgi:hypothetical protein